MVMLDVFIVQILVDRDVRQTALNLVAKAVETIRVLIDVCTHARVVVIKDVLMRVVLIVKAAHVEHHAKDTAVPAIVLVTVERIVLVVVLVVRVIVILLHVADVQELVSVVLVHVVDNV